MVAVATLVPERLIRYFAVADTSAAATGPASNTMLQAAALIVRKRRLCTSDLDAPGRIRDPTIARWRRALQEFQGSRSGIRV
jgi:hypothetical protein